MVGRAFEGGGRKNIEIYVDTMLTLRYSQIHYQKGYFSRRETGDVFRSLPRSVFSSHRTAAFSNMKQQRLSGADFTVSRKFNLLVALTT